MMVHNALRHSGTSMTPAEVDLLFRAVDTDRDGFLQDSEKIRRQIGSIRLEGRNLSAPHQHRIFEDVLRP